MSKYALRLPDSLMNMARDIAKEEDTSLNQLFISAIAEKISAIKTEEYLEERARRASLPRYRRILLKVKDRPPREGDEAPSC
ncbi:MAG: toxin-antitoxin system HicB family antitoxin [Candidatus Omnitrophica bacterium]|nr:hypothetical protein [bacterium]NUN96366.1 toxin-antitoxin system HicB family antitoxin [Candidatus Omnitrophota bacterium]